MHSNALQNIFNVRFVLDFLPLIRENWKILTFQMSKKSYINQKNQISFAFESNTNSELNRRCETPSSNVISIEERITEKQLRSRVTTFDRLLGFSRKLP